jgi:hypothetical protein
MEVFEDVMRRARIVRLWSQQVRKCRHDCGGVVFVLEGETADFVLGV